MYFDNKVESILEYVNGNPFSSQNEHYAFLEGEQEELIEMSKGPWKDKGPKGGVNTNSYRPGTGYGFHREGGSLYFKNPNSFLNKLKSIPKLSDKYFPLDIEIQLYNPRNLDRFVLVVYANSRDSLVHFTVDTIQTIGQNKLNHDEFNDLKKDYGKYNSLKQKTNHLIYKDHTVMGAYQKIARALKALTDKGWVGLGENENPYEGVFEKLNLTEADDKEIDWDKLTPQQRYYLKNKEKFKERSKAQYQNNKEKLKAYQKNKYVPVDKEKDSRYASQRNYYNRNKERILNKAKEKKVQQAYQDFQNALEKDDILDSMPLETVEKLLPKGYQDFEDPRQFLNHINPESLSTLPLDAYITFINPSNLKTLSLWVSIPNGNRAKLTLYTAKPYIYQIQGNSRRPIKWLDTEKDLEIVREQVYRSDEGLRIGYKENRAVKEQSLPAVFKEAQNIFVQISKKGFTVLKDNESPEDYI